MFAKFKNKDNVFKDLIRYQKPLKTLYQQLVLKGYTDTEEEFLDKVLKIAQGKESQRIDDLIEDLENVKNILNNIEPTSYENKENIVELQKKSQEIDLKQDISIDVDEKELSEEDAELMMEKVLSCYIDGFPYKAYNRNKEFSVGYFKNNKNPLNTPLCYQSGKLLNKTSLDPYENIDEVLFNFDTSGQNRGWQCELVTDSEYNVYVDPFFNFYVPKGADPFFINDTIKGGVDGWQYAFLEVVVEICYIKLIAKKNRVKGLLEGKANYANLQYINVVDFEAEDLKDKTCLESAFLSQIELISIKQINLPKNNNFKTTNNMFGGCRKLIEIPLFDTSNITDMSYMFKDCERLEIIPHFDTSNVLNMNNMFIDCSMLRKIPLFDTSNVTDMSYMFAGCIRLTEAPLFDTSNVTDMSHMFNHCYELKTVPHFDTSNVTDMSYMFGNCNRGGLTEIPLFDTSNVINMNDMFFYCEQLTTVPHFDTSNVTKMNSMFEGCKKLTTVPHFDTSNVTKMNNMFTNCEKLLEVPLFDTSNVTNMRSMLNGCDNLTKIPHFDTSNVTDMGYFLGGCNKLVEIPLFDTSNVTNMENMFNGCTNLIEIPELNTSNVINMVYTFINCKNLEKISRLDVSSVLNDYSCNNMFKNCDKLSYIKLISTSLENLQNVINELPTHDDGEENEIEVDNYIIDLSECTIDVSSITAPTGWTIKLQN